MNQISTTEQQLIKAIKAGVYRDCYLIYNRKSTDEPDNQKNSISYQKAENGRFVQREQLPVAPITFKGFAVSGIISERHSGFKEDDHLSISRKGLVQFRIERPKFQRLMQYLSAGLFKGVVVLCWDRISRNRSDSAIIRKLMRKGIDFRFVMAKYDKTSSGALHMDIDGMFAEHHSRVTSEKVSTAIWNLRERGICTYRAPIGYLNTGKMEDKPFDPIRAPIIKDMFKLYATGTWSLADIARWANKEGLTTVPMRRRRTAEEMLAEEEEDVAIEQVARPITPTIAHSILTNRFYLGKILGNDRTYIPSVSHQPLIAPELFNAVQAALHKKKTSLHYTEKLDLPHRGLLRCALCTRLYTPYEQKGNIYLGAKCLRTCPNPKKNISASFLEEQVGQLIAGLHFTDEELAEIDARTQTDLVLFEEKRLKLIEQNERRKKKVREDLSYLLGNRLTLLKTGVYTPESFLDEEGKLDSALAKLQSEEIASDAAIHEVLKDVIKLSELLKDIAAYYENTKTPERERMIREIFSELHLSGETLSFKLKTGLRPFESRLLLFCDPTTWLSELVGYSDDITSAIEELTVLVAV